MNRQKAKEVDFGEGAGFDKTESYEAALAKTEGKAHYLSLRPGFPYYYVSPKKRGYVLPEGPYRYRLETTAALATLIESATDDPAAPPYLGTSDGWVELTCQRL